MSEPPTCFSIPTLAEHLQVHSSTIYRLLKKRQLPAFKVGRGWRFQKAAIEEWEKHQSEVSVYGSGRYESKVRAQVQGGEACPAAPSAELSSRMPRD